jgi:hypothetical protein
MLLRSLSAVRQSLYSKPMLAANFSDGEDLAMRGMGGNADPGNRKILIKQQAHPIAKPKSFWNEKTADTESRPPFTHSSSS